MVTHYFECEKGHEIEKFQFGNENLDKWKKGKLKVKCPKCNSTKVKHVIPKGSGQFQAIK